MIVNLRQDCVEVHERPAAGEARFESVIVFRRGDTLALEVGADTRFELEVARLLP